MAEFPRFEYSNRDVKRAGKIIAGDMAWTDETEPEIRQAFQIANSWRDAHAFPMRSVRLSVLGHMRGCGLRGISAARLKRMQAIRQKLRRTTYNLNQLQDLGGCRIILPTIDDVHTLIGRIKDRFRHALRDEDNYISDPKDDGYRSHHLMFTFVGRDDNKVFDGRRIELQIRTRHQHAWATTIEAVGLFRNERLNNQEGSGEWLRLFQLMSAEIAELEACPVSAGTPAQKERRQEIRFLAFALQAMNMLDSVGYGVRGTDLPLSPGYRPSHYLIRFDHATKTVYVTPQSRAIAATQSYDSAENMDNQTGADTENVVLVEVDKLENLKAAYPNYFGDVELFKSQLRGVVLGHGAAGYEPAPKQSRLLWEKAHTIDPRWLRANRFQKPGSG